MCACELNCPRAAKVIMWKTCKIKISLSLSLSLSLGSVSGMNTGQSVLSRPQTAMPNRRAAQLAVLRLFLGVPIQDLSAPRAPPPQAAVAPGMADPLMMRQLEELSSENAEIADWLIRLTHNQRNWGFGLCFLHLRNVKGFAWNHKRVYRIYLRNQ